MVQPKLKCELFLFGLFDRPMYASLDRARGLTDDERRRRPDVGQFAELADALRNVTFTHIPSVPFSQFQRRLDALGIDLGVCPINDTAFNRCRSAIKFYQYAASGAVTLANAVGPFADECDLQVPTTASAADWAEALTQVDADISLRNQHFQKQEAFVREHRTWTSISDTYAQLLQTA